MTSRRDHPAWYGYPAFLARAGARTGLSAFFGAS
jgi:hypothetical protein